MTKYIDFEKLEAIDPLEFRSVKPYPFLNTKGLLTEQGFSELLANMPDVSMFEHKFGYWICRCKFPTQEGHWPAFWLMASGRCAICPARDFSSSWAAARR